jgi:hypothetical protein
MRYRRQIGPTGGWLVRSLFRRCIDRAGKSDAWRPRPTAIGWFLGAGRSGFHFDAVTDYGGLTAHDISRRGSIYFLWCLGLLAAIWIIGFLPAILLFLLVYLRVAAEKSWTMTLGISLSIWTAAYLLFHYLLRVPWPESVIGNLVPTLRTVNSIALF